MPSPTEVQVLISLIGIVLFLLPIYKVLEEKRKTKKDEEEKEAKEKKAQADQLHQRINRETEARHKNEVNIADMQGEERGYRKGLAEARAQFDYMMKVREA